MCQKKAEKQLEEQKDNIFEKWEELWKKDIGDDIENDLFLQLFLKNYDYVKYKIKINKRKNFLFKYLFLFLLIMPVFNYVRFTKCGTSVNSLEFNIVVGNSVVLVLSVLLCNWISKLLDIKKYQETWARHSQHKFKIDTEMLLYVCNMKPYNNSGKKVDIFKERVIKIWDGNHKKFVNNMENKEVPVVKSNDSSDEK